MTGFATAACALALSGGIARAAGSAAASLARGDELYAHGQTADARLSYEEALSAAPNSSTTLCRLARVEADLADEARGEDRRRLVADAVRHARAAVKAAPESADGHVWLAVALRLQARDEGPKTRLALAREIKSEVDRGIAIDPAFGRAYRERAIWNRTISRRGPVDRAISRAVFAPAPRGASMENAVRDLKRAIELEPADLEHRLELGRTFLLMRNHAEARRELERTVALPASGDPRDARRRAEARELLAKLPKQG